jgi:hypothetical protein
MTGSPAGLPVCFFEGYSSTRIAVRGLMPGQIRKPPIVFPVRFAYEDSMLQPMSLSR